MQYADGSYYEGTWHDHKKNGLGVYTKANGESYNGQFINGLKEGQGVFKTKGGSYLGQYK